MNYFFLLVLLFFSLIANAQKKRLFGRLMLKDTVLSGAEVKIEGTAEHQLSQADGTFNLLTKKNSGQLRISLNGFPTQIRKFDFKNEKELDLGDIDLQEGYLSLKEVILTGEGVVDLEKDRKTPTAFSTVKRDVIRERHTGNVEFPNVLKNTPSAYVSSEAGGFGDAKLFIRGFDQSNVAFLLNGQPVNGVQNGFLYWSNWNGLTDIVNTVQVQRGLGSSKLAVSSVGGTVNMVTKTTAREEGGFARFLLGNDSFLEGTFSYDTGINENGWAFSFLIDYWQAHRKYAKGTHGEGQNYFFSVGKKAGSHNFNLLLTGAPLIHDQNPAKPMELYEKYGRRYNNKYGYKNGKYLPENRKFYHKPIVNFNWDWQIDEGSQLSTVLYASFGHGGGTQIYGKQISQIDYPQAKPGNLQDGPYLNGLIDWDYIQNESNNKVNDGFSRDDRGTMLSAMINNNKYYGGVINYEYEKFPNLDINIGADIRFYRDHHFKQLTDKLGLKGRIEGFGGNPQHRVTDTYPADPWSVLFNTAGSSNRVDFDYSEKINYQGGFGQVEWTKGDFSVFLQGAVSNQYYKRLDRGNFKKTKISKPFNKTGYNIKGGASWQFMKGHTLFANVGNYSRQPFLANIFTHFDDRTAIDQAKVHNEKITGFEAGYHIKLQNLSIRLDGYYTTWENRLLRTQSSYDPDGDYTNPQFPQAVFLFRNIAELHQGLELSLDWKVNPAFRLKAYGSLGKWNYDGQTPVSIKDDSDQSLIAEKDTNLKHTKVGQAPQTSGGIGVTYVFIPTKLSAYVNWNYYGDLYGFVNVEKAAVKTLEGERYQPEKLNSYSLVDLGANYTFALGHRQFEVNANVYNLLDHFYISQKTNAGYYPGNGTTYNVSVKYLF